VTSRIAALGMAGVVIAACGDPGDPATPRSTVSGDPSASPAQDAGDDDGARPLATIEPPVDVVSTDGAIASWPRIVPGVEARAFTSYDRTGGNDDGFAGTWSELYEDGRGEHTIFDAFGPGVLRTLWFTSAVDGNGPLPEKLVRFYFDDEATARITVDADALFAGTKTPFVKPLVAGNQESSGGFASWAPLVYRRRLRITTEVRAGFYQAFYDTFPADWDVASSRESAVAGGLVARFAQTGFSTLPLAEVPLEHAIEGEGTIDVLRFEPEAPPSTSELQSARIRIWFDGALDPQVDVPLGMFFGSGLGEADVRALAWTMAPGRYESRFPMPFWKGARLAVTGLAGRLLLHTAPALEPREEIGTFTAVYRESKPTTPGVDHPYVDVDGAGKLVATVLTVEPEAPADKQWWEGDLRSWIDDRTTPGIAGTGHEDDHLGGWSNEFLERPFSLPMQGCPKTVILDQPAGGQTNADATMYRLYPGIPFLRRLRHSTEHGPSNTRASSYASAAFLYRQPRVRLVKTDAVTLPSPPGRSTHRLAIESDNVGVKLRWSYAPAGGRQRADVIVDGVRVGAWYVVEASAATGAADADFFLPPQVTKGKRAIDVTIVPAASFSATALEAWSVRP
jgi:hypothetical protein